MDLKGHELLLKRVQRKYPKVVLDGAVDNKVWSKQRIRILWILKGVDDFSGDLRELLRDPELLYKYSRWKEIYGLVAKVSYRMLNRRRRWQDCSQKLDYLIRSKKIFRKIAVVNLNKYCGVKKLNEMMDIVFQQIDLLEPTVVIFNDFILCASKKKKAISWSKPLKDRELWVCTVKLPAKGVV